MAIQSASAKLYTGIRCWCVDKNISAALTASFSLGNRNRPASAGDTVFANVLAFRVKRFVIDLVAVRSLSLTDSRLKTFGGGNNVITPGASRVIDNTNNWKVNSSVVCKFPTYFRIDVEKLQLPQGTTCTVSFEEGWITDGNYLESTKAPSAAIGNFFTFRTPWLGASFINSAFTLPNRTGLRIKQLTSALSSPAALVAYPIFNPGKLAALFGGVFFTLPTAVKTARGVSSMVSSFASNTLNLRIKQLASIFDSGLATLTTDAEKYKTPGVVSITSNATISAAGDRSIGVITAFVADAATMNTVAVKTARITKEITATASMSVDGFAQKGLPVTNLVMTASMSIIADVPMVLTTTDTTVQLPIWFGSINAVIDWGDGTTQTVTSTPNSRSNFVNKTYATAGTRTIYIKGSIQNWGWATAAQFLSNTGVGTVGTGYQVSSFGDIGIETLIAFSAQLGFNGQTPVTIPSSVTDISYFYYTATDIYNPSRLQYWNTSNIQKMEGVFRLVQGDASALPIGSWNTGSATTMRRMFRNTGTTGGGANFNTDISSWNTSNVTDMSEMFMDTNSFNRNINAWDVGSVTTFEGMFSRSSGTKYNQNLADWDVSSATNMNSMLFGAGTYTHDLSGWCVTNIPTEPPGWDGVTLKPIWGTCPP
jgi:surface protein